mgnify:CR=1 FL=1
MANQGKNFKAVANDIAEGFITVNPIFLKPYDKDDINALYKAIERKQIEIRAEPFPYNDNYLIRKRNLKLQRLFNALMIIKNFAREKNFLLFR